MQDIGSFFAKFKRILDSSAEVKKETARVLSEVLGISITSEDITVKDGIAKVKASGNPVFRSELSLKKNQIISRLRENPVTSSVREVR